MSVQELTILHQRYVDLSHRFRAGWVYHQFTQSLRKVFEGMASEGHAAEFQELYTELKDASQALTASEIERTRERLDDISGRLEELNGSLIREDSKVSPKRLRQFFQRFQRYDEKILVQLARFLVYAASRDGWNAERIDKLDFLLTRIGQQEVEGSGTYVLEERKKLREILESLWALTGADPPLVREVEDRQGELEETRAALVSIPTLDDLNERGLLARFRAVKHRLGPLLLEPDLLTSVLETNLAFKNLIRRLYRKEERRIVADYQQVFDLEGEMPISGEMARELGDFRREIESFEKRLQQDDFRLGDLARIRGRVRSLLPRLQHPSTSELSLQLEEEATAEGDLATDPQPQPEPEPLLVSNQAVLEICAAEYEEILDVLGETEPELSPKAVSLQPAIFALRLEPREVVAYRRLTVEREASSNELDEELERFLLEGAALRIRLNREVEAIKELLDDTASDFNAPIFGDARLSLRVADEYSWRYNHRVHQLLMDGRWQDARFVEVLRMRLLRDFAGLWLLVYKPFLEPPSP